jgi:xanthine permease XanP
MAFLDSFRRPPALTRGVFIPTVLQHFGLGAVTLVIPRIIAQAAGVDAAMVESYCQLAMIALGIATLLQASGWRGIGSGYLLPACFAGIYVAPALAVASTHGLGAVAGLTIVAGVTQIVLSRILRQVRGFLPSEVIGVGVLMIGLSWGMLGLKLMCGVSAGQVAAPLEWISAAVALAVMVTISVWGGKSVKPVAMLIGLGAGCLVALLLYTMIGSRAVAVPELVMNEYPRWPLFSISFADAYLPGFMIGAVASFLRVAGDVVASHQVSDRNWKRASTRSIASGGMAEGLANVASGLLGTMPVNTSSGSVGLVAASGISAPQVARWVGVMWIVVALLPFGPALLLLIPASVQGAAVFYTGGFVVRSGLNMLTSRMIDNRRAIAIGSALIVGLSFDEIVRALALPPAYKDVFSSALLTAVAVAILLTALFRIGVKRTVEMEWDPASGSAVLESWIEANGRLWGARTDLIAKTNALIEEFAEAAPGLSSAPLKVTAHYDEVSLTLVFGWSGRPFSGITQGGLRAGMEIEEDEAVLRLAAAMVRHRADHISEARMPGGWQELTLVLDDV